MSRCICQERHLWRLGACFDDAFVASRRLNVMPFSISADFIRQIFKTRILCNLTHENLTHKNNIEMTPKATSKQIKYVSNNSHTVKMQLSRILRRIDGGALFRQQVLWHFNENFSDDRGGRDGLAEVKPTWLRCRLATPLRIFSFDKSMTKKCLHLVLMVCLLKFNASSVCPAGKYNATRGNSTFCESCKPGTYNSGIGATACVECSAGKYSTKSAANTSKTCDACPTNSYSAPASSTRDNCTCNAGYTGSSGNCSVCPSGTFKKQPGPAPCLACGHGSNSTPGAAECFCLPGYQQSNRSVNQYDPGVVCAPPDCPLNGSYTAPSGLLCRLGYRNNEVAHWLVAPAAPHAGLRLTFLAFETELQNDFVSVYLCLSLACCRPSTAEQPDAACFRSTPITISGRIGPDPAAPVDHCGARPLLRTSTNPIQARPAAQPHRRPHAAVCARARSRALAGGRAGGRAGWRASADPCPTRIACRAAFGPAGRPGATVCELKGAAHGPDRRESAGAGGD